MLIYAGDSDDVYLWAYNHNNNDRQISGATTWPGKQVSTYSDTVEINNKTYHVFTTTLTNFKFILSLTGNNEDSAYEINGAGTYIIEYVFGTNTPAPSVTPYASTHSGSRGYATTTYYPIVLNVENGEYGTTYTNTFAEKSKTFTVNHTPDAEHKAALTEVGYTGTAGTNSTELTMPANYNASNKVTVNYEELAYYPVTFSAGPNGSIKATTGSASGTEIKSGTMVKEDTKVYFKATGNDNYVVNSWSGDTTTNSAGALNTNTQTEYL